MNPLKIFNIEQSTPTASIISFELPDNLKEQYRFKAGQYVSLEVTINGAAVRRSYSICSSPSDKVLSVGIKEVKNGLFSTYANNTLSKGDIINVGLPEGRYTYEQTIGGNITIFASGSGITPNMSIIKHALEHGQNSQKIHLIYGNKSSKDSMFLDELKSLENKYPHKLEVTYIFSRVNEDGALFGRIDTGIVSKMIKQRQAEVYYICGPKDMNDIVIQTLKGSNTPDKAIRLEAFQSKSNNSLTESLKSGESGAEITLNGEHFSTKIPPNKNILETLLKEKIDAPHSCRGGVCASCIARLNEGEVEMLNNQTLTDEEIKEGLILTCQSYPKTPLVKIDYDSA